MLAEVLLAGGVWATLSRLGPVGEILLGLADASVIPTPGSLDILLILLVAGSPQYWWIYVIAATIGSALGAYITFHIGQKGGKEGLEKRIPKKQLAKVYGWSKKYGVGAVAVPALLPPPFPLSPFLLAAGALQVPKKKFFAAYSAGRTVRYGIVAWLGHLYGKHLIHVLRYYSKPMIYVLIALAVLGGLAATAYFLRRKHQGLPVFHSAEKRTA
jgi:membrane protein YqaA with SNARE-associated domain